ncbi:hypothetical protein LUZ60_006694 [Juncus effusus]|nr:hypothetical protein LUZ60_006694 [Juncus effusus]
MDNDTELRLGLPGCVETVKPRETPLKRSFSDSNLETDQNDKPQAKTLVVGWPPLRSYRKNSFQLMKRDADVAGRFVKVSMDGAPYLRKIDLKNFKQYEELREALEKLFKYCFSPLGESLMEGICKSEYAITYEDKDGDLMLVGDVPWEMFVSTCKKVRIMKNTS